jgi:hypothetical protein
MVEYHLLYVITIMQSICRGHYERLEYITQEGEINKNLNKGEFYKYLGINQS